MNGETLKNFVDLLNGLVIDKWFGEIKIKMEAGRITIGEKKDKIKFDNSNYLEYKSRTK